MTTAQLPLTGLELKAQGIASLERHAVQFGDPRLPERFWQKVTVAENGCWEWQAKRSFDGYGIFSLNRRPVRAHRLTYQLFVGPISSGLEIDHLCRNPACILPSHLEAVSHRENMLRGVSPVAQHAQQTHCVRGHTLDNAYISPDGRRRHCRTCVNAGVRRRYWANPEKARAVKRRSMVRVKARLA